VWVVEDFFLYIFSVVVIEAMLMKYELFKVPLWLFSLMTRVLSRGELKLKLLLLDWVVVKFSEVESGMKKYQDI
jgi:hypothetical protein